jgi:hypothetical protein
MPDGFTAEELIAIPYVISQPRFSTYLRVEQDHTPSALALYRWNLQISAAFFMPLQICEVAIRNATAEAIEAEFGDKWPWTKGFSLTLPVPKRGFKPRDELANVARKYTTVGQVIPELKFAFWQYMFTSGQETRLWDPHLRSVLPHLPAGSVSTVRQKVHDDIDAIREFRNRIAHHEPIFARNIGEEYQRIMSLIAWRSPETANWVDRTQTVTEVLARRPRASVDGVTAHYPVR